MPEQAEVYTLIEAHYRKHQRNSIAKLRNGLGGHHNAEDAVQEAYARACKYWKSFKPDLGFDQWMATILGNCIRDIKQDNMRNGMMMDELVPLYDPPRFDMTDHIMLNEVRTLIEKQDVVSRYVLNLYLFEGYTGKEVAEVTNLSADAIRKMVSRFKETHFGERAAA